MILDSFNDIKKVFDTLGTSTWVLQTNRRQCSNEHNNIQSSHCFTGGRSFTHPSECAKFNATRYAWVRKRFDQTDEVKQGDETIVYQSGTLYGEWPDGTTFDGNRYIDRYVVKNGLITSMEVWNDSAERILTLKGIEA